MSQENSQETSDEMDVEQMIPGLDHTILTQSFSSDVGSSFNTVSDQNSQETVADKIPSSEVNVMLTIFNLDYNVLSTCRLYELLLCGANVKERSLV